MPVEAALGHAEALRQGLHLHLADALLAHQLERGREPRIAVEPCPGLACALHPVPLDVRRAPTLPYGTVWLTPRRALAPSPEPAVRASPAETAQRRERPKRVG